MKYFFVLLAMFTLIVLLSTSTVFAQSVVVELNNQRQTIRGFGGMNHRVWQGYDLNESDRDLAFGNGPGEMGMTVLRVWVSPNENQWPLEVATAQDVISRGGIVYASAWNQPSNIANPYTFERWGSTVNSFKIPPQNYGAYIDHLNRFNDYMHDNGVPLYAIGFQNEPDWAGGWTHWSVEEVYNFTRDYVSDLRINGTKVITAESFHYNKDYYDGVIDDPVALGNVDIIGAHFYGSDATSPNSFFQYPLADEKASDKERWMTEHYTESQGNANLWKGEIITGDQDVAPRRDTVRALDVAYEIYRGFVEGNFNQYTWWYIRRNYSLIMHDTQSNVEPYPATPAEVGRVTKRGYCMAQFSKYIRPGFVRVDATKNPLPNVYVSAYKNLSEDSVVVVVVNRSHSRTLNFSIPGTEGITSWTKVTTSESKSLNYEQDVVSSGGSFSTSFDFESVTTLIGVGASQTKIDIPGRIEAEKYSTMSGIRTENNTVGDGRHIGYINPDDWARYLIDVQESGEYSLRVRVSSAMDANNTITFKNESGATVATVTVDASQTTGWQDWYIETTSISLEEGEQELLVEFSGSTEFLYNIDWFEIVSPPAQIPGKIEAESFSAMSGIEVEPDPQGDDNVGFINSGDWTKYLIDVAETGTYSMKFRVATGVDANNNIIVKNESESTIGTLTVDASQTAGWHDWYIDSIVVDLTAGVQEITLEFDGSTDYLYNIDWFELYPVTTSAVVFREFESAGFSVWSAPNPFVKGVSIFVRAQKSYENLKVELYNINGEKVFESRVGLYGQIEVANSQNLRSGIYYIVLWNNNKKVAIKSLLKL